MSESTCTLPGCERPLRAKGLCASHYNASRPADVRHRKALVQCSSCGALCIKQPSGKFKDRYCSSECRYRESRERQPIASGLTKQLVIWYGLTPSMPEPTKPTWINGQCRQCGLFFTTTMTDVIYCSNRCASKYAKRMRRAREHGSTGTFTWSEFMRVFLAFDRKCAYCERKIEGQPEPDHVLALSRGGSNSITNILPSCKPCNSGKSNRTLDEWSIQRVARGAEPRVTAWVSGDPRVRHLVLSAPIKAA